MTQTSEERLPEPEAPSGAQILPFDRQSPLQRAVQLRARDTMEKQRNRREFAPVRWTVIFLLALIPVGMMFGALDGFLRAIQHWNAAIEAMPVRAAPAPVPERAPAEPGVVILEPWNASQNGSPASPGSSAGTATR